MDYNFVQKEVAGSNVISFNHRQGKNHAESIYAEKQLADKFNKKT